LATKQSLTLIKEAIAFLSLGSGQEVTRKRRLLLAMAASYILGGIRRASWKVLRGRRPHSSGHASRCRYFWHSRVVSERVTRDRAKATSSSVIKV
jgi:hypothetical protein